MAYSFPSQFTRLKDFLDICSLVVRNSIACVFPMWFLTTFESKPEILRGPTMQFHPSLRKILPGFQLLSTEKARIFLLMHHIFS